MKELMNRNLIVNAQAVEMNSSFDYAIETTGKDYNIYTSGLHLNSCS